MTTTDSGFATATSCALARYRASVRMGRTPTNGRTPMKKPKSGPVTVLLESTGKIIRTIDTERRHISETIKKAVWARDGLCCRYCGFTSHDASKYQLDHVFPVSQGGGNSIGNLVVACVRCNRIKGSQLWWRPLSVADARAIKYTVAKREQRRGGRWRYLPDRRCLPGYTSVVDSEEISEPGSAQA